MQVDLRTNLCMQPIKNQGKCASSWAFAATAVTEFHFCRSSWGFKVALRYKVHWCYKTASSLQDVVVNFSFSQIVNKSCSIALLPIKAVTAVGIIKRGLTCPKPMARLPLTVIPIKLFREGANTAIKLLLGLPRILPSPLLRTWALSWNN